MQRKGNWIIGEPGVGKTAIVEGLAMRIVQKKISRVLFNELHTIVGAGGASGSLDASNMFKPALARGDIQVIGATTLDEYRKYIEKDGALERRFQKIMVDPPS